jgi:predicted dehydrogenase
VTYENKQGDTKVSKYRVALAGLGKRGHIHAEGFAGNPDRFEMIAFSEINEERLKEAANTFGVSAIYTDTERMLAETKPDVFCFATMPHLRLPMIELAAKYGVKAVAFEKPMSTSIQEARQIVSICKENQIKAIVCHQHKYIASMQKLKQIVDSGEIGAVTGIHGSSRYWMSQLGTHFMDYIIWANGGAKARWVVGHIHGRQKLSDTHPSPDYILGQVLFDNGIRAFIECGYLSPSNLSRFAVDNRLTVYGTHGYVWAESDGRWQAVTRSGSGLLGAQEANWDSEKHRIQVPYLSELADWLDDDARVHPCSIDVTFHGYEILEGLCLSALNHSRIDLPLSESYSEDIFERMDKVLEG